MQISFKAKSILRRNTLNQINTYKNLQNNNKKKLIHF